MELPYAALTPGDGGVWWGRSGVQDRGSLRSPQDDGRLEPAASKSGAYFAMRSSAEIMALPISAVPMVRQPSCAMSAVR